MDTTLSRSNKSKKKLLQALSLFILLLLSLSSCGDGGGSTPAPYIGEGSPTNPMDLGVVEATPINHPGSIGALGAGYYTFTTGSMSGMYTIGLTSTQSDLGWGLFADTSSPAFLVCDNIWGMGDEICDAPLTSNTTYYLMVLEFDGIVGSYMLTLTPPIPPGPPLVSFNFDGGTLQGWTTNGSWGVTTAYAHSGSYSVTDSPGGNYVDNTNTSLISPVLDLTGTTSPTLSFYHRYTLEPSFDYGYVEISTNGGVTFGSPVRSYTGTLSTFTQVTIDLSPYKSSNNVVIRFRLTSDFSVTYDGWYIDDIVISQ